MIGNFWERTQIESHGVYQINDAIQQKGAIAPEVLNAAERKYFFNEARQLGITVDQIIE